MVFLNPMLNKSKASEKPKPEVHPKKKERCARSDKCDTIRIPVEEETRRVMRTLAASSGYRDRQTAFNTALLLQALKTPYDAPEREYKDSGQYMTVKPTQIPSEQINDLAISWGVSRRRAAHRLLMWMVDRRMRP